MELNTDVKLSNIVISNHKFTYDLYQVLPKNENTFFSPFSIQFALMLMFLGAEGETAEELALHLPVSEKRDDVLNGIRMLLDDLKNPQLNIATEIFIEQTYRLKTKFVEEVENFLNSHPQKLNFKFAAEKASEIINSWVSLQTNKKIENLIPPGIITKETKLVLVNAVHFKDDWLNEFKQSATCDKPFYNTKDNTINVKMMNIINNFNYLENETFKVLKLPYQDPYFNMVILLPKEIDGLSSLEQQLPSLELSSILEKLKRVRVNVSIPKFKLEKFINLNDALGTLGILKMFDERNANFSGMYESSECPLVVSKVVHKAFVEVNEEGTEAAAATACPIRNKRSLPSFPEEIYTFIVDRPFIFFIIYNEMIIFIGRMNYLKE